MSCADYGDLSDDSFIFKDITWQVPNISSLVKCVDHAICSPSFSFAGGIWNIQMYPYGQTEFGTEGAVDIMITRLNSEIPAHNVFLKICFKTCHGRQFQAFKANEVFCSNHLSLGVINYVHHSVFITKRKVIAPDDTVTIICQMRTQENESIRLHSQAKINKNTGSDYTLISNLPKNFQDNRVLCDYKKLLLSGEIADVVIKVKGQEFPAHKAFLIARSSVFASTFRNDMKEKATGIINIDDCDPNSFSDFLCFLYCGSTENLSTENVFSIFTTADKYDVQDLRSECLNFLKKNLSIDTFCDTISLALRHSETELIRLATDFFAKNLQEIIVTVKWQSFLLHNTIQGNELLIKALTPGKLINK